MIGVFTVVKGVKDFNWFIYFYVFLTLRVLPDEIVILSSEPSNGDERLKKQIKIFTFLVEHNRGHFESALVLGLIALRRTVHSRQHGRGGRGGQD